MKWQVTHQNGCMSLTRVWCLCFEMYHINPTCMRNKTQWKYAIVISGNKLVQGLLVFLHSKFVYVVNTFIKVKHSHLCRTQVTYANHYLWKSYASIKLTSTHSSEGFSSTPSVCFKTFFISPMQIRFMPSYSSVCNHVFWLPLKPVLTHMCLKNNMFWGRHVIGYEWGVLWGLSLWIHFLLLNEFMLCLGRGVRLENMHYKGKTLMPSGYSQAPSSRLAHSSCSTHRPLVWGVSVCSWAARS